LRKFSLRLEPAASEVKGKCANHLGTEAPQNIKKICDAEEPKRKRLPNLNILTYQVCRRLYVEIDGSLLKIPKGKIPHDRCRRIFEVLGGEYVA
jgi:hypothetical protein